MLKRVKVAPYRGDTAIPCTRTWVTVTYWPQRARGSSPSFHRWENWDLPGLSGWLKSQQPSLKSQDANQLPNSHENVLSPKPGYLFQGPATWKPVAASLTTQNYNYMPQITRARGQEQEPGSGCLLALHLMVWVSRWSSDPIREGKANTQTRTSSSRIKSPLV